MNNLYSLLSSFAWLEEQTFSCHRPPKRHILPPSCGGDNIGNETFDNNNHLIQNVTPVIREIPMELSYSDINLFLNLLWTPRSPAEGPKGASDPH